jgi:hypothetical protein
MIPLALRALPWRIILPALGAGLALWAAYSWAHGRGVASERAKWQAASIAAEKAAVAKTEAMQAQVDIAGVALSEKQAQIDILAKVATAKTRVYYANNPAADVACLLPERVRAVAKADAAAASAITAK